MVTRTFRLPKALLPGALCAVALSTLIALAPCVDAGNGEWTPAKWVEIGTLEILTVGPAEGEHWSKLWLVVIDDQIYVRLGSRATERIQRNTAAPYVSVKIAGRRFDRVRVEHVPEFRERVSEAMAKKYRSDLIIRFFPHPMTVRLTPETTVTLAPRGTPVVSLFPFVTGQQRDPKASRVGLPGLPGEISCRPLMSRASIAMGIRSRA